MESDTGLFSLGVASLPPRDDSCILTVGAESLITSESPFLYRAAFLIKLCGAPEADVTIPDIQSSDEGEGTVTPASLLFTPGDWETPRQILLRGVDDNVVDNDQNYTITIGNTQSADALYNDLAIAAVTATNLDDDAAGVTALPVAIATNEEGTTAIFTVFLKSEPAQDVIIGSILATDPTEGVVAPGSLTFTQTNWQIPQSVTVTGVNDSERDGDITYDVTITGVSSADPFFNEADINFQPAVPPRSPTSTTTYSDSSQPRHPSA